MSRVGLARLAKQAAGELGIDGSYWYRKRRDGRLEIWTPYIRRVWTPPRLRKDEAGASERV